MLPVYIVLIVFSFLAFKVWSDRDLKREKILAEAGGKSLGTSELKGIIQEAVQEAINPMEERLDLLESHMRQLPEHETEGGGRDAIHPDEPIEE